MTKNYSLQSLPPEERPRERLKQLGAENLSLQELLALIIERGNKKQNVLQLSQELISHFGNLDNIKNASLKELKQIKGIGPATACKIKAALEIGKRGGKSFRQYQQEIKKPVDVFKLLKPLIGDKKKEHFVLLSLDTKNHYRPGHYFDRLPKYQPGPSPRNLSNRHQKLGRYDYFGP